MQTAATRRQWQGAIDWAILRIRQRTAYPKICTTSPNPIHRTTAAIAQSHPLHNPSSPPAYATWIIRTRCIHSLCPENL